MTAALGMPKNSGTIVLIGPMGVGKTTIGKKLARTIDSTFRDTDTIFVAEHGPIADFFAEHGEQEFRDIEAQIVKEAVKTPGVIATGGGAPLREDTQEALKNAAFVVYLATDGKHMASRLAHGNRPLITDGIESWKAIYQARKPIYEAVANVTIDTSSKPLAVILDEIKKELDT
jgi:shikimate kinase